MKIIGLIVIICSLVLMPACERKTLSQFTGGIKKPSGVYIWETEIMGANIVTIFDFRSDGSVFEITRGIGPSTTERSGTWVLDDDNVLASIRGKDSTHMEVFRWEGDDLLLVRQGENGQEETLKNPPRYRKK
jgi:hypothetical protein